MTRHGGSLPSTERFTRLAAFRVAARTPSAWLVQLRGSLRRHAANACCCAARPLLPAAIAFTTVAVVEESAALGAATASRPTIATPTLRRERAVMFGCCSLAARYAWKGWTRGRPRRQASAHATHRRRGRRGRGAPR